MGAFGEKLRKQREQRGLDLDAISNTTKISTRMLRALEDEHFDQLPGGIFNKGFVRAYARQVGLDEDETVADYLAASRENPLQFRSVPPDSPAAKPTPVAAPDPADNVLAHDLPADKTANKPADKNDDGNDQNQQRRTDAQRQREDRRKQGRRNEDRRNEDRRNEGRRPRAKEQKYPAGDPDHPTDHSSAPIPWGKLALALLLVTLLLAVWNFRRRPQPTATSQPVPFSNQSPAPVPPPASAPTPGTLSGEKLSPAPISTTTTPIPTEPASSTAAAPAANSANRPPTPPDANPPAAKPTAPAAAPKPPGTFTLLIRAEKNTWISLVADGRPVAQENLIAPAHTSVRATREIVVKAGNAAGISFVLNGKEIPAQGSEGEVKTYVFDATGLRTAPQ